jgi:hypothetical protein
LIRWTFRSAIQLIGILGLGCVVFFAGLSWRLSTGPISIAFLSPYLESALKTSGSEFDFKLEDTVLTWPGWGQSFDIRLIGARAIAVDGTVVASIPELAVSLSGAALIKGRLAPQSLTIFGPSLNVVRTEAGKLELGLNHFSETSASASPSTQGIMGRIVGELLAPRDIKQPFDYLRRIDIVGGNVTVDDRQLGLQWMAPETDISLVRQGKNVSISAQLIFKPGDAAFDQTATFTLVGDYDFGKKEAKITFDFTDLNLVFLATLSKKFEQLKRFDLPVNGTVDIVVLSNGEIQKFEFDMTSNKGKIAVRSPIELDINVHATKLRGKYDYNTGYLHIENLTLDLGKDGKLRMADPVNHEWAMQEISLMGIYDSDFDRLDIKKLNLITKGVTLNASATIQEIGGEIAFELGGQAANLVINQVREIWPKGWGDVVRDWTFRNLSKGVAPVAHARMTGRYSNAKGMNIISIVGDMEFRNMTIDYLAPMLKATEVKGRVKFDDKRLDIEITHGRLDDLMIRYGNIVFTGLDQVDQYMDANLEIDGPLGTALTLIDSTPLGVSESFVFASANAKGDVSSKIAVKTLIERKITVDKVIASAEATIKNVEIKKITLGLDLTKGNFMLSSNNKEVAINGSGQLGGIETKILWDGSFSKESKYRQKYELKAVVDERAWRDKLKLKFPPFSKNYMTGSIGANVTVMVKKDGSGDLDAELDFKDTKLILPRMGWLKSPKVAATAFVKAEFSKDGFISIPKVLVQGAGMNLRAAISFKEPGKLNKVAIDQLTFGKTDVQAIIAPLDGGGWDIDVSGERLNLVEWLESADNAQMDKKSDPLRLSLNVDSVQLYPNKKIKHINGILGFDGWVWHQVILKGGLGDAKLLDVSLVSKEGKRFLYVTSNDAGEILQTFDYYDNLVGGRLTLKGEYDGMFPDSKFSGHARIDDFRVLNAPTLAKLLSVASVTGMLENLGGLGLFFAKLYAPFESVDDIITIKNASLSGLSLGLTASGTFDTAVEALNLEGTIVPAYALNTALTRLPLVGPLFSGGEKDGGIFAANYTMTGSVKEPNIVSNPLSILAPGFLRGLFKIFDGPTARIPSN